MKKKRFHFELKKKTFLPVFFQNFKALLQLNYNQNILASCNSFVVFATHILVFTHNLKNAVCSQDKTNSYNHKIQSQIHTA